MSHTVYSLHEIQQHRFNILIYIAITTLSTVLLCQQVLQEVKDGGSFKTILVLITA